jgi:hypothetical protein
MNSPQRQLSGAALLGRRIGIGLFWCMAVFVIGMSTYSVLHELYGSPDGPGDPTACATTLDSLHASLLEQASHELRLPRDPSRAQRWLTDWDRAFAATSDSCASLTDTRHTLLSLRERVEAMLRDYARDELPLTERIERALQRYVPRSTPPRKT